MNHLEKFNEIHTFIFDVDGVLTNNEVLIMEDGALLRKMNIRDGYAIKKAVQQGFRIAVITGGKSLGLRQRLESLGVTDVYLGIDEKMDALHEFVHTYELDPDGILYMGDDIPDYHVMRHVGFPACPRNAAPEILEIAAYVSPYTGGDGCVRDVIEKVLRLKGKWMEEEKEEAEEAE